MLLQLIIHRPEDLVLIIRHTPPWVGGLAVALTVLGLWQRRRRSLSLGRAMLLPAVITVFSVSATVSLFAGSPQAPWVLCAWGAAAAAGTTIALRQSTRATYDAATRRFDLPGSWVPLAWIGAIFLGKYAVGVELSLQPQLPTEAPFALTVGAVYGAISGIFAGRAWRLWRLIPAADSGQRVPAAATAGSARAVNPVALHPTA
jgi:hypothetical protein